MWIKLNKKMFISVPIKTNIAASYPEKKWGYAFSEFSINNWRTDKFKKKKKKTKKTSVTKYACVPLSLGTSGAIPFNVSSDLAKQCFKCFFEQQFIIIMRTDIMSCVQ